MFPRCCLIHMTIIILRHCICSIFVSMCRPRSAYAESLCFVFHFQPYFHRMNHITSWKQTRLLFVHFLEYLLLFLEDNVDKKKLIIFKSQKFSVRVLRSFCLIFCQFQPGATYKSVAYKKSV